MMQKMNGLSMNIEQENINRLHKAFPECFTEGKLDVDKLLSLCGEYITDDFEKYEFKWKGKSNCLRLAQKRSTATLRPVPEDSVNWDTTQNLYIEGDNLEVLKLLQESYLGKIKMIYIDPPYNTGHDFIYPDTFIMDDESYDSGTGYFNEAGEINYSRENSASAGKYHSDWCSMMYSRCLLARNLLTDDGIMFLSIDDNEIDDLMKICNEVFSSENYLACFPRVTKKAGKTTDAIAKNHDYVLAYSKTKNPVFYLPYHTDEGFKFSDEYVATRGKYKLNQTLDYDSLQYMIGELDGYSLPAADKEKLAKIKQAASVPDWETLKRILY